MNPHENAADHCPIGGAEITVNHEMLMTANINECKGKMTDVRLRHLSRRLHELGPRPLYEFLKEIIAGRDPVARLEAFAGIDPSILAAFGGAALPQIVHMVEGSAQ